MKLYLDSVESHANGGIRRVVEAQYKYLPEFDIEITSDPMQSDVEAVHVSGVPKNPNAPFILHNHGMMWSEYNFPNWAEGVNHDIVESVRYAYRITSPSQWVTNALARGIYQPIKTIYHGIDTEEWKPDKTDFLNYVLWNKARTDEVSDSRDMNRLAELLPDVPFVSTFGTETSNVKLIGNRPNDQMKHWVQDAGLYLCTARETFGIGTLEALACGVPVVGWDYGGQSEIIRQGETGYLAPYNDYPTLAEYVRLALKERERLSANARQDCLDRWQWRDKIEEYAKLYFEAQAWYSAPRPKVSVIVPAHNLAKYLPFTLDSVQKQTMTDFECLVIDDCSTDNTSEIARAVVDADIRFRYLKTYENLKLSGVRNYGAQRALGKYLIYVDADDLLTENALLLLSNALDKDRSIHIAYGSLDLITEEHTHRRRNPFPGEFNWYHQIAHQNQIPTAAMMRREVVEQSGGWRTRQWRAEDAEFWARVTSFGYRARKVTDETTLLYRVRRDSKGSIEFRTYSDHDGNWLANIAWRSANSASEGVEYLKIYGNTVPQRELVPFGADAKPGGDKFWHVSHRQEPLVTILVEAGDNIEDTLDSIMGQYVHNWRVIAEGKPLPGFPYVKWVPQLKEYIPQGRVIIVKAGEMFSNDWLNIALQQPLVRTSLLPKGKVLLQYVGRNAARTQFRVNSNTYFGYQGAVVWAEESDVEKMVSRGQWQKIPVSQIPEPQMADHRKKE